MKNIFLGICFCLITSFAFAQTEYTGQKLGESITPTKLNTTAMIPKILGKSDSAEMKITGKVSEVCQNKGCWMTLELPNGEPMRVTFKNYAFFMPKDIAGKTVVLQGMAKKKTTSVKMLRHYAEDARKSPEEIAKITNPKNEIAFEANGVVILDK